MDTIAVQAEYQAFYRLYQSSKKTRSDAARFGGQISGLRRRELMKERLPILNKIFDKCGVIPTLNVCKRADKKIFKVSSNFKAYPDYFPNLNSKRNASDKILVQELSKLDNRSDYAKLHGAYLVKKKEIEGFFDGFSGVAQEAEKMKKGFSVDPDLQVAIAEDHPEMLL